MSMSLAGQAIVYQRMMDKRGSYRASDGVYQRTRAAQAEFIGNSSEW
jgi:hypothetical protein